ncbi:MAG TPA: hypothetical protein VEF06_12160 [Bryobacteraceae bacterium]|nr:hypothetical protein [Bryobacteraceae bacterium]
MSRNRWVSRAMFLAGLLAAWNLAAASLPQRAAAQPVAVATVTSSNYCFARVRGLRPELLPPAFLVLQVELQMTYHNPGDRPLILPLAHEHKLYTSLAPGTMKIQKEPVFFTAPSTAPLKHLPADVNPDNPVQPENDVFGIIPARGQLRMKDLEEVTLTIYRKSSRYQDPDLRGHRVYLRLRMEHQELDAVLDAVLSDRWAGFGVPWSGKLLANTLTFDVPASVEAQPCADPRDPHTVTNKPPEENR